MNTHSVRCGSIFPPSAAIDGVCAFCCLSTRNRPLLADESGTIDRTTFKYLQTIEKLVNGDDSIGNQVPADTRFSRTMEKIQFERDLELSEEVRYWDHPYLIREALEKATPMLEAIKEAGLKALKTIGSKIQPSALEDAERYAAYHLCGWLPEKRVICE